MQKSGGRNLPEYLLDVSKEASVAEVKFEMGRIVGIEISELRVGLSNLKLCKLAFTVSEKVTGDFRIE